MTNNSFPAKNVIRKPAFHFYLSFDSFFGKAMHIDINPFASYCLALLRYLLGGLFIFASVPKIRRPKLFVETVKAYKLLPQFTVRPFSYGLSWLELCLGILLLIGWSTKLAAAITGILYAAFTIALTVNLIQGRKDLNCGCFGVKSTLRKSDTSYSIKDKNED